VTPLEESEKRERTVLFIRLQMNKAVLIAVLKSVKKEYEASPAGLSPPGSEADRRRNKRFTITVIRTRSTANRRLFGLCRLIALSALMIFLVYGVAAYCAPETKPQIQLTQEERTWLREHPVIRVVQDPGWPPIEYIDDTGKPSGITSDYLSIIEERLGIKFVRISGLEWHDAYTKLINHEIDMTTSVAETPYRLTFWAFTKPYMHTPIVIITQSDVTYISHMRELSHKRVSIVDGYAAIEWIQKDYPDIEIGKVTNAAEGLELLRKKEVYAFIENMLVSGFYMAKLKIPNIKIAGETPFENAQCMAVRKDWPELAAILQKALDSITQSERDSIYYKWVPVRYERGIDYTLLLQATGIFSILLLIMIVWNRRLHREIDQRKRAEAAKFESAYRLQTHVRETPMGYIEWDLDFKIKDWNPAAEKIFGYSLEEVIERNGSLLIANSFREKLPPVWSHLINDKEVDDEYRHIINENITKSGETITCEWINTPITSREGNVIGITSLCRDITPQVHAQEQLQISLAEKEILLRELYHRTKNNMQVISAFLQLKAQFAKSKDVTDLVQSVLSRIQTMSLVHEKLYQSKNLSRINIREYIQDIVSLLQTYHTITSQKISITYDIEDMDFVIDTAIPLGLVVNEIVTNAFKHAFPDGRDGTIGIQLHRKDTDTLVLTISDDGVGLPEGFDVHSSATFGMMTTQSIVEMQMKGKIEISGTSGVTCTITVKETHPERIV